MRLNRRVPNGTHGGVRGRGLLSPSYSIILCLFIGDIHCADEVPPDDQSLLFPPCTGYLFRLLHFDLFHERADDLCRQFGNLCKVFTLSFYKQSTGEGKTYR